MAKVLIIEDEPVLLEQIVTLLHFEGFEAAGASNGEEGVRLAHDLLPDLILCDIMLPRLDGYGVLRALQCDPVTQHIPFIFLTAKADHAQLREGMVLGADDYITKPFTRDELLEAIQTRLAEREAIAQVYQDKVDALREMLTQTLPHEFRTPLTSLVGYAQLLATDNRDLNADQIADMAGMIVTSGERLRRHLENSWLYAQLVGFGTAPEHSDRSQHDWLEHPAAVIRQVAQHVACSFARSADLMIAATDDPVALASESLAKIVEELTDNAFKFSEPGTPVQINAFPHGESYVLRVTDRGRGMAADQIKDAGAYVQFNRTFFEQQGVGLGLTLVRAIVELYGGELAIAGQPEQGTQVTVTLPLGTRA